MKHLFTSLLSTGAAALLCLAAPAKAQAQTYQLVWADEFNGSISSNWVFETGGGGWGNNERQYYQRANATVTSTELQITAFPAARRPAWPGPQTARNAQCRARPSSSSPRPAG